jgi:PPP family 3-phenylpropionic acid transporter
MSIPARLGAYYFAYFTYAGVLVPYLSLWLAAQGFAAAEIALVLAMPQVARIFAPAAWGWIADRTGWQREIVVFSAFAVLIGFAAFFFVHSVASVTALMLLLSVLASGSMPLVEAAALSATRARPGSYGPVRVWGSIGFILAVLSVGAWLDHHGPETILPIVVVLAAIVCVSAFGVPARATHHDAVAPARLSELLARGDVLAFFGACMCMSVAHGALYAFLTLHLEAAGYSKVAIGALWTLGSAAEIGVFFFLPQLMRRYSLRALLIASFACAAVRFLVVGWAAELLALLVVAQLMHAATFGAFHAASLATVHRLFSGRLEARGQALYSSLTYGVGGAAGTLIAGWTWESLGAGWSFTVSSLAGLLGAVLVAWKLRFEEKP